MPLHFEAMRLEGVELRWLDLHLQTPVATATGVHAARPVVIVRLVTDQGEGYGECAALAAPTYSEEYAGGAWRVLRDHLVPRLLGVAQGASGNQPVNPTEIPAILGAIQGNSMAKAALEMAVLDAHLRATKESLASYLGVTVDTVEAGGVVGVHHKIDALLDEVSELVASGYRRVKCKILPGHDFEPLTAIREEFPDLMLSADANGSYDGSLALRLAKLDNLGLAYIEQPLPADDLLGNVELAKHIGTPICLDESLSSVGRVADAVQLGACEVACLKPARLGGYLQAQRALEICVAAGMPAWCGGMFETGFARAGNAAFSGLAGCTLPGDLGGSDRFVEQDPSGTQQPLVYGRVRIYKGFGIAPPFDDDKTDAATLRKIWLSASD